MRALYTVEWDMYVWWDAEEIDKFVEGMATADITDNKELRRLMTWLESQALSMSSEEAAERVGGGPDVLMAELLEEAERQEERRGEGEKGRWERIEPEPEKWLGGERVKRKEGKSEKG